MFSLDLFWWKCYGFNDKFVFIMLFCIQNKNAASINIVFQVLFHLLVSKTLYFRKIQCIIH